MLRMRACIFAGAKPEVWGVRGEQGLPPPHRQGTQHDLTLVCVSVDNSHYWWAKTALDLEREAAKKFIFLVARPLRGGWWDLLLIKKTFFEARLKNIPKNARGKGVGGQLKNNFFCGFPKKMWRSSMIICSKLQQYLTLGLTWRQAWPLHKMVGYSLKAVH